ncbi:hypothetical protein FHX44_11869 [Pseudonocardia hierapolitana]|uniref:Uncharacterized protein n=1 Tax=Pseudonocardia hierapolitana TaxID=1128676 RepID=A0A561SJF1_9PSEU|nr:hypothetical protein FHX44_11869 [Pseudonocardia hierapolitana]
MLFTASRAVTGAPSSSAPRGWPARGSPVMVICVLLLNSRGSCYTNPSDRLLQHPPAMFTAGTPLGLTRLVERAPSLYTRAVVGSNPAADAGPWLSLPLRSGQSRHQGAAGHRGAAPKPPLVEQNQPRRIGDNGCQHDHDERRTDPEHGTKAIDQRRLWSKGRESGIAASLCAVRDRLEGLQLRLGFRHSAQSWFDIDHEEEWPILLVHGAFLHPPHATDADSEIPSGDVRRSGSPGVPRCLPGGRRRSAPVLLSGDERYRAPVRCRSRGRRGRRTRQPARRRHAPLSRRREPDARQPGTQGSHQ